MVERHPNVEFDFFADDWQGAANGLHTQVLKALAGAAADLREAIVGALECKVAANKAAIVASTPGLAADLRRSLGTLAGDGNQVIKNLGVCYSSGKRTACRARTATRARRIGAIVKRAPRLKSLTAVMGNRSIKIYTASFRPAAGYGMEVWGCPPVEPRKLQARAGACLSPFAGGSSLTAKLLIHGDPSATLAVAAAMKYAREVWRAGTCPGGQGKSLPQLKSAWDRVNGGPPLSWPSVKSPVGVCMLELRKSPWKIEYPFRFVGDRSQEPSLLERAPALIQQDLLEGHHRQLARRVALKSLAPELAGARVTPEPVQKKLKSRVLSPLQKGSMLSLVADGLWTQTRLASKGYLVDVKCKLCNDELHTIYHRLYCCPAISAERKQCAKASFLREARAAGSDSQLFTRGWFPHPGDSLLPTGDLATTLQIKQGGS